jgi:hypothetical protein
VPPLHPTTAGPAANCPMPTPRSLVSFAALALPLVAQCAPQWSSTSGVPGVAKLPAASPNAAAVTATGLWDPDGAGPAQPLLVVGGRFDVAGSTMAANVATFDPVTSEWAALGAGANGEVSCFATLPNGDLVAGGHFTSMGSVTAHRVARWDGAAWAPLSTGMNAAVLALATLANGEVVAGGEFVAAGGIAAAFIARWNGISWASIGSGADGPVHALAVRANGNLVAGGAFGTVSGISASRVAEWNGTSWSAFAAGVSGIVHTVIELPFGEVVVGGAIGSAGGIGTIATARWNGTAWSAMPGFSSFGAPAIRALAVRNGELLAGGSLPSTNSNVYRWSGSAWLAVTSAPSGASNGVHTFTTLANGDLIVGGSLENVGTVAAERIARWNGVTWAALGVGTSAAGDARVNAVVELPGGDIAVGGRFATLAGVTTPNVARWSQGAAFTLGGGIASEVSALATLSDGSLVAGAGQGVVHLAGTTWVPLGNLTGSVLALARLANGVLVAGGSISIPGVGPVGAARWDGSSWSALGAPAGLGNQTVYALAALPNGDLIAGTGISSFGNSVALWNGLFWAPLGTGVVGAVRTVAVMPNGDVLAGGVALSDVWRWNGALWSSLGALAPTNGTEVRAMARLPSGSLVIGGSFTSVGGVTAGHAARWANGAWQPLGVGVDYPVHALILTGTGRLVVGGAFLTAGGAVSVAIAEYTPTCPATATTSGTGCVGSGGPNAIASLALPWLGSSAQARATGMPVQGIAVGVVGFAPAAIPLATLLPAGSAGCWLLATPDALQASLPTNGSASLELAIPHAAALIGMTVHAQVAALELDTAWNIVAATATQRLTWTLGVF